MKSFQPVPDATRLWDQAERKLVERGCDPSTVRQARRRLGEIARSAGPTPERKRGARDA